jgi:hypothetical protein
MWRLGPLLLVAGLLTSCTHGLTPEQVQAWVGRPAADLSQAWGPPTREVTDEGLRVMIYEELDRSDKDAFSTTPTRDERLAAKYTPYRGVSVYARSYLFWVDAKGVIVRADRRQP